jgi:L-aspartate oxidase
MANQIADYVIVGSGIAGLSTALALQQTGHVIILTKLSETNSNTYYAQGGIAAAIGQKDSPQLHLQDTLEAGAGHCNPLAVSVLVKEAPRAIQRLVDWGIQFDRQGIEWHLGREGSHSVPRILHVDGDATGRGIIEALLEEVHQAENIEIHPHTLAVDLLVEDQICYGVMTVSSFYFARKGVVLATGGCGQIYKYTTNDRAVTGDGLAMAYRAGAVLMDMEFVQFHPTALAVEQNPMLLVSEAVRGEGAILVNQKGEAFMERYHRFRDLAPRDVVSRAIFDQMSLGNQVFLDATSIGERFHFRFPKIFNFCKKYGIDPATMPIPVTPVMHFLMGGIRTDFYGRTKIARLFACGEVACTGVHGANRLASNSLLEGAVFSQRVAEALANHEVISFPDFDKWSLPTLCIDKQKEEKWKEKIRDIMWQYAGIIRTDEGLRKGLQELKQLAEEIPLGFVECRNMLTVAQLIHYSALQRTESRGGHYRIDCPEPRAEWEKRHIFLKGEEL